MKFDMPSPDAALDKNGAFTREWVQFLTKLLNDAIWRARSGTTAHRPTEGLEIGTPYFDTSLGAHGKPIWCSQVKPAVVWVDATSAIV